jgi:hypothetical protein
MVLVGLVSSGLSITNSNPEISKKRLSGFVMGLGKLFYLGESKNYLNLSLNYTSTAPSDSSEPIRFILDNEKFPDLAALNVPLESLNFVELKLSFHYGLKK